jgi:exodeoxyribonuclease-5
LSSEQEAAVIAVADWFKSPSTVRSYFYLAGYAGTGKSTVIRAIVKHLSLGADQIRACAFTAKAAKVLERKLGMEATTLHSLNYIPIVDANLEQLQDQLRFAHDHNDHDTATHLRKEVDKLIRKGGGMKYFPRPADDLANSGVKLIVADECSMLHEGHVDDLHRHEIPVLYVGDQGQLDPVEKISKQSHRGVKPFSAMFNPDFSLTHVHRQAEGNPILTAATLAREGQYIPYVRMLNGFGKCSPEVLERNPAMLTGADVVLCQRHITRRSLIHKIRTARGFVKPVPLAGETVVCRLNNQTMGVARGEQFTLVSDAERDGDRLRLLLRDDRGTELDLKADRRMFDAYSDPVLANDIDGGRLNFNKKYPPFDFGYVLTVHSAQGSEWSKVLLFNDYADWLQQKQPDQYRRWLYTGITRASKQLLVVE